MITLHVSELLLNSSSDKHNPDMKHRSLKSLTLFVPVRSQRLLSKAATPSYVQDYLAKIGTQSHDLRRLRFCSSNNAVPSVTGLFYFPDLAASISSIVCR